MELTITKERNQHWFEETYRTHHGAVRSFVLRRAPDLVDDVLNETFATMWTKRDHVPQECLPWLLGTARNHLRHSYRTSTRQTGLFTKLTATHTEEHRDHAEHVAETVSYAPIIADLFNQLGPADSELLQLWAWEELTGPQIATVLGLSKTAVRSRLLRAKRRAQKVLGDALTHLNEGEVR